jgi:hypothetical protein
MLRKLVIASLLASALPTAALAATVTSGGPRIGFSVGPEQIQLGGQIEIAEIAPKIAFVPNLELGFGDGMNVIGFGFDLHYRLQIRDSDWTPYFGAGIALNFVEDDAPAPADNSRTDVGGVFLFGAAVPTRGNNRFFAEMKLGLGDTHDLKLLAGWNFRF